MSTSTLFAPRSLGTRRLWLPLAACADCVIVIGDRLIFGRDGIYDVVISRFCRNRNALQRLIEGLESERRDTPKLRIHHLSKGLLLTVGGHQTQLLLYTDVFTVSLTCVSMSRAYKSPDISRLTSIPTKIFHVLTSGSMRSTYSLSFNKSIESLMLSFR